MKILYFIKWVWRRFVNELKNWEQWQWAVIVTMFFGGGAVFGPENAYQQFCAKVVVCILFFYWACYVVAWGSLKDLWKKFHEEQQQILDHFKEKSNEKRN
jgi:hypothetical protein